MSTRHWLFLAGKVSGPHELDAYYDLLRSEAVNLDTLLCPEGTDTWQPLKWVVPGAAQMVPPPVKPPTLWQAAEQWVPLETYGKKWFSAFKKGIAAIHARTTYAAELALHLTKLALAEGVPHPAGPRNGPVRHDDLSDPASSAAIQRIIDTQNALICGQNDRRSALDRAVLDVWPCWELVPSSSTARMDLWRERWITIGEPLCAGRLIAHKKQMIWQFLSRFNQPHPPFDFDDGLCVEEISHDDLSAMGLCV